MQNRILFTYNYINKCFKSFLKIKMQNRILFTYNYINKCFKSFLKTKMEDNVLLLSWLTRLEWISNSS